MPRKTHRLLHSHCLADTLRLEERTARKSVSVQPASQQQDNVRQMSDACWAVKLQAEEVSLLFSFLITSCDSFEAARTQVDGL